MDTAIFLHGLMDTTIFPPWADEHYNLCSRLLSDTDSDLLTSLFIAIFALAATIIPADGYGSPL
jgi:hypothetical protein